MESIFFEIRNAIANNVPEIKWIDLDEGQLENFDMPPVDYPCVLIGFPQARFENMQERIQTAELTISVKIAFKLWEKFNSAVPLVNQPNAFDHFTIMRKLVKYLHGLAGENRSRLVRVSSQKNGSPDPKIYEIGFECAYYDDTAKLEYMSAPRPNLEVLTN